MRYNNPQYTVAIPLTPVVKKLIIANVAIWVVGQLILDRLLGLVPFLQYFSLMPANVVFKFHIWQPVTYMFLHSVSLTHILFNMLFLWMFGSELEQRWGSRFFMIYYLVSGIGAAIIYTFIMVSYAYVSGATQGVMIPVVGASGAIYGLMLAYGILFGERVVYFMMMFPMKAKWFVLLLGGIQIVAMLNTGVAGGGVAYLAHLGGLASGFVFLYFWTKSQQNKWKKKSTNRRNLRLVVDNEREDGDGDGPRYWN